MVASRSGKGKLSASIAPSDAVAPAGSLLSTLDWPMLTQIGVLFAQAGAFLFGSGLAMVLFLYGGIATEYGRLVHRWIDSIGLDDSAYRTHTLRRRKASLIDWRPKNLRAVQLLLGHTKIESTVRYLGIEVEDALEMASRLKFEDVTAGERSLAGQFLPSRNAITPPVR